jgi:L-ascorbate 6-phosphate lactonase
MNIYNSGSPLVDDIKRTEVPAGAVALWALGQEGFLVKTKHITLLFDPYLSDWVYELFGEPWVRSFAPPLLPEQCADVDYVLCSHHHEDHMDKRTLQAIAHNGKAKFIVPRAHLDLMKDWGIAEDRLIGISHAQRLSLGGCEVEAFAAMHEVFEQDERGEHKYLGFIVHFEDLVLYHAGDTIGFPELTQWLKPKKIDVALIPINGRDFTRGEKGILGNCNYREAVDLAVRIEADVLIPMHFGLFPHNDENPAYLVDYLFKHEPQQKFHMMSPGERYIYVK